MGKVKSRRQKYHASAARLKKNDANRIAESADSDMKEEQDVMQSDKLETSSLAAGGLFQNVEIDISSMKKQLPDFDARSTITSKTLKGSNMTKKDKRKLKHDIWMKRVDTIQAARKEAKNRKKRQETAIVGDMRPLEDTLPTLELLLRDTPTQKGKQEKKETKPKGIKKTKTRQKEMMSDISLFQQVLKHPSFQKDPTATISEHLKNKLKQEDMDT